MKFIEWSLLRKPNPRRALSVPVEPVTRKKEGKGYRFASENEGRGTGRRAKRELIACQLCAGTEVRLGMAFGGRGVNQRDRTTWRANATRCNERTTRVPCCRQVKQIEALTSLKAIFFAMLPDSRLLPAPPCPTAPTEGYPRGELPG